MYEWTQTAKEVVLIVEAPAGTKAKAVQWQCNSRGVVSLHVQGDLALSGTLRLPVVTDECDWELADAPTGQRCVRVTLVKQTPNVMWESCFDGEPDPRISSQFYLDLKADAAQRAVGRVIIGLCGAVHPDMESRLRALFVGGKGDTRPALTLGKDSLLLLAEAGTADDANGKVPWRGAGDVFVSAGRVVIALDDNACSAQLGTVIGRVVMGLDGLQEWQQERRQQEAGGAGGELTVAASGDYRAVLGGVDYAPEILAEVAAQDEDGDH